MDLTFIQFGAMVVFGMIFLAMFLVRRVKKATPAALACKAMTSVCFMIVALMLAIKTPGTFSLFVVSGLLFGLLGDIWLDLKYCYPQDDDLFTKLGFSSFAVGHLFFIAAIVLGTQGGFSLKALLCACGVAVIVGLVVFFGEKAMKLHYGSYKMISTLYGALLFFMTAFAIFSAVFAGIAANKHLLVMGIGGVFFAVSDLILSGTYFGEGKNRPVDIVTNHVTYYIAQFVIAGSLLFF